MTTSTPPPRSRRTQEQRSALTRTRLLDATVESLIEIGYGRTTTTAVCDRAGLSRGAQIHHYPTKAELVIAAVAHLARRRFGEVGEEASRLDWSGDPIDAAFELMWASFEGPLFLAALELWVAARTDPELHKSLYEFERGIGRSMSGLWKTLAGDDAARHPAFDDVLELGFYVLRGMALQRILRDDDTERRRLFEVWKCAMRTYLRNVGASLCTGSEVSEPESSREEIRR